MVVLLRRFEYFVTHDLNGAFLTPDGFKIASKEELISYWDFFVEQSLNHRLLSNLKSIVDVGANAGVFTYWILSKNPGAMVEAFEPLPAMESRFKLQVPLSGKNVTFYPFAVSDKAGHQPFYFSSEMDTDAALEPGKRTSHVERDCVRLDDLIEHDIDLLKIDTQGHDLNVLRGAANTIKRTRLILIELSKSEVQEIAAIIGNDFDHEQLTSLDYLFYRKKSIPD